MTAVQDAIQAIGNPYWDAVCDAPRDEITWQYQQRWEPDMRSRHELVLRYSWAICSPQAIAWMVGVLDGRGVVEVGAGRGYWAWQLTRAGVDVVAYDIAPPAVVDNQFHPRDAVAEAATFHPVWRGDARNARRHGNRALFSCWPPYGSDLAYRAVLAWKGDLLVYCGEGEGGCCANDDFFDLLDREWEQVSECESHMQWPGMHDQLTAYRRKPKPIRFLP